MDGYFGEESIQGKKQVFRLLGLSDKSPFSKKSFADLGESDQRKLKGAVLRAINIRQMNPKGEKTSIYHIFERLNTGGTPLKPQEIRNCVFRGGIVNVLRKANQDKNWRKLVGKNTFDRHQKDVELVLRIFALTYGFEKYEKPMKEFLNNAMLNHQSGDTKEAIEFSKAFPEICAKTVQYLPEKPFHLRGGRLNVSALDSVLATILMNRRKIPANLGTRYSDLVKDEKFNEATLYSTSDVAVVKERFKAAKSHLIE